MESLKTLSTELIPLQLFGLQFFSVTSINQFAAHPENFSLKFIFSFAILFPVYSVISSYYYIYGFVQFEDVKSSHNFLQYELKIITYAGRFLIISTAMFEAFVKTKKTREMWTKGWKISKLLSREFGLKLSTKYSQLRSVMRRRLAMVFIGLTIVEILPQISPNLSLHAVIMSFTKLIGSTIISLSIYKHCFYVDFVNLQLNILTGALKLNFRGKIKVLRQCYIEIVEMARLANESVEWQLPITVSIIIMCLVRRAYRFYALFTGQLHIGAFIYTIMNNTSEEIACVYALCFCCDRTERMMSNLMEAVRKIDYSNLNLDEIKALSFFSDQISKQPIGFYVMSYHKLNVEYLAEICTGIISYIVILLQFERIDD